MLDTLRETALGLLERLGIGRDQTRLLLATLASGRHRRLDPRAVGQVLERTAEPITQEMVAAYAAATDDDNPCYRGEGAVAPPLLVSRLVLPLIREVLVHPDLHMNILRMVHAEQVFTWVQPLRVGDRLRLRLTIAGIEQTRAGELLRLAGEALRGDELLGSAGVGLMVRGPRRRARGKGGARQGPRPEAFRLALPTSKDQALRYAAATGDANFIHTSPTLARLAGLPGTILHGMCVLAMSCATLVRHRLNGDPRRCRGLRARFSHPARPGETLVVVGHRGDGDDRISFEVLDADECPVIRGGELLLR